MKIGVVGLGLIGGSIFKKLKELNYDVIGVSRTLAIENVSSDYNTLKICNIVFVCTPMNKTPAILDKLDAILDKDTIVTDVCSLKTFVSKKHNYKFIPSHPMAGTEFSGWENSFPELFKNAKWAITPIGGEIDESLDKLEKVINNLGAKVIITTAEEHDKAVALISHAPMVIAQALCKSIKDNELAKTLASSGFRDATRLALSNTEMASDMLNFNKTNIEDALESYRIALQNLLNDDYETQAKQIKEFRKNLYN